VKLTPQPRQAVIMTRVGRLCIPSLLSAVLFPGLAVAIGPGGVGANGRSYAYRISWNGIPAARATVRFATPVPSRTEIRVQIQTNRFVDLFWSLRAESWGEVDEITLHPLHFGYDRRVNGERELTTVEAEASGELTGRYARAGRYRLIEVNEANVLDPAAAILQALREPPIVGQPKWYEIFTGEARYRIELRRDGTETIQVPAGRFTAARIEPVIWRLENNQPDRRVRRVALWITDAIPHTLLRVRGDVFIGAVYCDLIEQSDDAGAPRLP
jgi:hypothetical protein